VSTTLSLNKQCSRCPRVEQTSVSIEEAVRMAQKAQSAPKAVVVSVDGSETGSFVALCSICRSIVSRHIEMAMKTQKHVSAVRGSEAGS
jgi:hypothetical protein